MNSSVLGPRPAVWDSPGHGHFPFSYKRLLFPPDVLTLHFVILYGWVDDP
jgi:hypothetical protein